MSKFIGSFEIYHGKDNLFEFFSKLRDLEYKKFGIIVDKNLIENEGYVYCRDYLQERFELQFIQIPELKSEPSYSDLDREYLMIASHEIDFLVGFGGGSVLDLAKGISILFTNPLPSITYRGMNKVNNKGIPLAIFPSTAGTGTEMTWTASFIDLESSTKLGINGNNMFPKFSVLEPRLLLGAPFSVILSASLDALVHSLEAVTSKNSTQFASSLGVASINKIFEVLPQVHSNPSDLINLELLQIAASQAGLAMLNSSGGPSSGISYPLGVYYKVPHGFAGGILLPYVIEENISLGYEGYSSILNNSLSGSQDFSSAIKKLYKEVGAPSGLQSWGFTQSSDVKLMTERTIIERQGNLDLNPILFDEKSVERVLSKCII